MAVMAKRIHKVGRRKNAVCRVYLGEGSGLITVNKKPYNEYFDTHAQWHAVLEPLKAIESLLDGEAKIDLACYVNGSGKVAQAGAVRLAIARAILEAFVKRELLNFSLEDGADQCKLILRKAGLLTRDSRKKERKKPGLHGARRAVQYSKR